MAQRMILHYMPGHTPIHRWDARCKCLCLLTIAVTLLRMRAAWLLLDSAILIGLLVLSRLPLNRFFREFRSWLVFLSVLFLFQVLFSPGSRFAAFPWIPVSREGLHLAGLTTWRLGLMLGYAALFTAVTRPRELQTAVIWFLKPLPFLPARRVGLMVSLTLRFFSVILNQAEEVGLAHKMRWGDQHRNPLRYAKFLALPIFRRSLLRAEEVTLSIVARGYHDDVPLNLPTLPFSQLTPVAVLLILLILL